MNAPRKIVARNLSKWIVKLADAFRYPTRSFLQKKYPTADPAHSYWYTDASVETLAEIPNGMSFIKGRILAIGTQERMYKGHDLLIRALAVIRESHPYAHLVLVGNGQYRSHLEDLVRELELYENVEFIDFLDGWEEVSHMIKSANVFAMPSRTEGLPRALLEAMSLGTACIGSNVAGIPELLPPYLLVPKESVEPMVTIINQILEDEMFRQVAAQDCLEGSRLFNATSMQPNITAWKSRLDELGR